ncbi:oxidoreductase, partial [Dickeya dianthicola]|nr:oxidoreductase [Dickeya dianthicola]
DMTDETALQAVIARTLQAGESIHYLPGPLDADTLLTAFQTVERAND